MQNYLEEAEPCRKCRVGQKKKKKQGHGEESLRCKRDGGV